MKRSLGRNLKATHLPFLYAQNQFNDPKVDLFIQTH